MTWQGWELLAVNLFWTISSSDCFFRDHKRERKKPTTIQWTFSKKQKKTFFWETMIACCLWHLTSFSAQWIAPLTAHIGWKGFFFKSSLFSCLSSPHQSNELFGKMLKCLKSHRISCKVYFLQWRQKTSVTDTGLVWLTLQHWTSPRKTRRKATARNRKLISRLWMELSTAVWIKKKRGKKIIAQILH